MGIFELVLDYIKRRKGEEPKQDVTESLVAAPTIKGSGQRLEDAAYGAYYDTRNAAVEKATEFAKGRPLTEEEKANTQALMGAADLAGAIVKPDPSVIKNINRYKKHLANRERGLKKDPPEFQKAVKENLVPFSTPSDRAINDKLLKQKIADPNVRVSLEDSYPMDNANALKKNREFYQNYPSWIRLEDAEANMYESAKAEWIKETLGAPNTFSAYPKDVQQWVKDYWRGQTITDPQLDADMLKIKQKNFTRRTKEAVKATGEDREQFSPLGLVNQKEIFGGAAKLPDRSTTYYYDEPSPLSQEYKNRTTNAEDLLRRHNSESEFLKLQSGVEKRVKAGEQAKYNARAIAADKKYKEQQTKKAAKKSAELEKRKEDFPILRGDKFSNEQLATYRDYLPPNEAIASNQELRGRLGEFYFGDDVNYLNDQARQYYKNIKEKSKVIKTIEKRNLAKRLPTDAPTLTPAELAVEQFHMDEYARRLREGQTPTMPQQLSARPKYEPKVTYEEWRASKGGVTPTERRLFRDYNMPEADSPEKTRSEAIQHFRNNYSEHIGFAKDDMAESMQEQQRILDALRVEGMDEETRKKFLDELSAEEERYNVAAKSYSVYRQAIKDLTKTGELDIFDPKYGDLVGDEYEVAAKGKVFKPLSQPVRESRTVAETIGEMQDQSKNSGDSVRAKNFTTFIPANIDKDTRREIEGIQAKINAEKKHLERMSSMYTQDINSEYGSAKNWAEAKDYVKTVIKEREEELANILKNSRVRQSNMSPEQIYRLSGDYAKKLNKSKKGGK